jgi:segregation and condensation protein B
MRFKPRSECNEQRRSERSRGSPLRELEVIFARSLDFAFAPLGMTISMSLTRVIEALLFSAQKPLTIHEITAAIKGAEGDKASETPNEFVRVKNTEVAAALEELKVEYIQQNRAFQLVEKAEGWQLATDPGFAKWVRQLFPAPKPARLSAPALETLAIIAYRQPITRADVEAVRGVNIDGVLQTLMERGLVKIAGRAEIPGRPLLYETTQLFLDHFGLRNLDELPNAEELRRRFLPVAPAATSPTATATTTPE